MSLKLKKCKNCLCRLRDFGRRNFCSTRCYKKIYDKTHVKERAIYNHGWYKRNQKHHRQWCEAWAKDHPVRTKRYQKKYLSKNKEKRYRATQAWLKSHPEHRLKYNMAQKEWRLKHPIKARARDRRSYLKNRDSKIACIISYKERHPGLASHWASQRRGRLKGARGSHTLQEWNNLKYDHNYTCVACLQCEPKIKLTRDHIRPLTKGGSDYIRNIQPLCGSCNSKKHRRIIKYV